MEIEESDLIGKSPEQIEHLKMELEIYKKWKEQKKLESERLMQDFVQG